MKKTSNIIDVFARPLIKLFDLFERKKDDRLYLLRAISAFFIITSLLLATGFVSRAVYCAAKKEMWLDESYTLEATIQKASFGEMILKGAPEQASCPPLDYLFMKIYDGIRPQVNSFGLPFNVYYRLHSISANLISGLLVVFIFFHRIKDVKNYLIFLLQACLLLVALGFYYFWFYNFQYSIEMRPYALWNALWFTTLLLYAHYGQLNRKIVLLLCLLLATASGAVVQMAALGASIIIMGFIDKEDIKQKFKQILTAFALPAAIFIYYYVQQPDYGGGSLSDIQQYYRDFYNFWLTKEKIPILSVLGIMLTVPFRSMRPFSVIFVCTLLLYLISPLINYRIVSQGYFFASRHYIYYDLIFPLFFIQLAMVLPLYYEKLKHSS